MLDTTVKGRERGIIRRLHQRVLAWMSLMPIHFADKSHWRNITICDISPRASKTGQAFRGHCLHVLGLIEVADPAAASIIAHNIHYIAHTYPLHGTCSYNHAGRLFLLNWRSLRNNTNERELVLDFAGLLFKSALIGACYCKHPHLFARKELGKEIERVQDRDVALLSDKLALLLSQR